MSDAEDPSTTTAASASTSTSSCNTADPSPASAAPSRSSTTVVVTHEDDLCERRRQQNREAQRRFRNKKIKEREAAAAAAAAASTTAFSTAASSAAFPDPVSTPTSTSIPSRSTGVARKTPFGPVVPQHPSNAVPQRPAGPHVPPQDSLSLPIAVPNDPFPPAADVDFYSALAYTSAASNHDTHDYFGHSSFPEVDALLAPYQPATGDESNLFTAASSIASPPGSYPHFDALQHPSYSSLSGLDCNNTVSESFNLDALFGRHSRGHSMSDHTFGWNPHSSLTSSRRVLEDSLPTPRPSTAATESYPTPSNILPGLRSHPDDKRSALSRPSRANTAVPPTPALSRKHTPSPTQTYNSSESGDSKPLLHVSIDSGHEGVVTMLLDSDVDINERDRDGSTALHLAVQKRQDAIIRLLLDRGASTNVKDSKGKTPTHLAIYSNFETGLKILLDHDARLKKRS